MQRHDKGWTIRSGFLMLAIAGSGLVVGCQGGNGGLGSAREISLADFSRQTDRAAIDESADERRNRFADQADTSSDAASDDEDSSAAMAEQPPALPQLGAGPVSDDVWFGPQPGTRVIVDSLVGQVNGRPIYADYFFMPIKDQLRAVAQRSTQREFLEQAAEIITQHLSQIVRSELFLADAQAQLTPQQRQGIFAWMRAMREQEVRQGGGTQTAAARRLQEQHGMTMDEYLAARRDMALLQKLQEDRIRPRVIVSWRDIEREYQLRFHEFNPPARMTVLRIRLSTESDAEQIEAVKDMLASGMPFEQIAEKLGIGDGGAWQVFEIGEGGVDGLQLSDRIKDQLRGLDVNETSEPFEVGASTWWLHIAEIHQPEGRSLYDPEIQRMLNERISQRRFNQELNRYMESLFADGVQQELDRMRERLLIIAFERYGPS